MKVYIAIVHYADFGGFGEISEPVAVFTTYEKADNFLKENFACEKSTIEEKDLV